MPPQHQSNISLYDAALVNVAPRSTKESPKKVKVKVTRKKKTSGGAVDFGVVKDRRAGSTSFQQPEKCRKIFRLKRNSGGVFIKPLTLCGESNKKQGGRK